MEELQAIDLLGCVHRRLQTVVDLGLSKATEKGVILYAMTADGNALVQGGR